MPGIRCAISGCKNAYKSTRESSAADIKYYCFPKDPDLCALWVEKCNRNGPVKTATTRICSVHFEKSAFERDLMAELMHVPDRMKLKKSAVPTLELPTERHDADLPITVKITQNPYDKLDNIYVDETLNSSTYEKELKRKKKEYYKARNNARNKQLTIDASEQVRPNILKKPKNILKQSSEEIQSKTDVNIEFMSKNVTFDLKKNIVHQLEHTEESILEALLTSKKKKKSKRKKMLNEEFSENGNKDVVIKRRKYNNEVIEVDAENRDVNEIQIIEEYTIPKTEYEDVEYLDQEFNDENYFDSFQNKQKVVAVNNEEIENCYDYQTTSIAKLENLVYIKTKHWEEEQLAEDIQNEIIVDENIESFQNIEILEERFQNEDIQHTTSDCEDNYEEIVTQFEENSTTIENKINEEQLEDIEVYTQIEEQSLINNTLTEENSSMVEHSQIEDNSIIEENSSMIEHTQIEENSIIEENSSIVEHSQIEENTIIEENSINQENTQIEEKSQIEANLQLTQNGQIQETSQIEEMIPEIVDIHNNTENLNSEVSLGQVEENLKNQNPLQDNIKKKIKRTKIKVQKQVTQRVKTQNKNTVATLQLGNSVINKVVDQNVAIIPNIAPKIGEENIGQIVQNPNTPAYVLYYVLPPNNFQNTTLANIKPKETADNYINIAPNIENVQHTIANNESVVQNIQIIQTVTDRQQVVPIIENQQNHIQILKNQIKPKESITNQIDNRLDKSKATKKLGEKQMQCLNNFRRLNYKDKIERLKKSKIFLDEIPDPLKSFSKFRVVPLEKLTKQSETVAQGKTVNNAVFIDQNKQIMDLTEKNRQLREENEAYKEQIITIMGNHKTLRAEHKKVKQTLKYLQGLRPSNLALKKAVVNTLKNIFTENQIKLLTNKQKKVIWTKEEEIQALTIKNLSKRTYLYLKNQLGYPLPGISTLQRWEMRRERERRNPETIALESPMSETENIESELNECETNAL